MYKQSINLIEGKNKKTKVAMTLQNLLSQLGREFEFSQFRKFLPEADDQSEDQD